MSPAEARAGRPVRIVIVMNLAELHGGAEALLLEFLRHLDRGLVHPTVAFFGEGSLHRAVARLGIATVTLPMARLRHARRSVGVVHRLASLLRRERPDLVVSWLTKAHLYAAPAAALAGVHDRLVRLQYEFPGRDGAAGRVAAAMPARAVVACSRAVADAERARGRPRPTVTVPPGIEPPPVPDDRSLAALRATLGLRPGVPVVGIVGRLLPWKGQDRFVDALAMLHARGHHVQALVVGGNAYDLAPGYEEQVRARAREIGGEPPIVFTGQVERGSDYLALLDVVVNASTPEPFGVVVLEAMAMRVPVVAVDAGGPSEIIEDGVSGVLVPTGSPSDLAGGIARLLDDPGLASSIAAAGHERFAREYSAARMAGDLQRALLDAAGAP